MILLVPVHRDDPGGLPWRALEAVRSAPAVRLDPGVGPLIRLWVPEGAEVPEGSDLPEGAVWVVDAATGGRLAAVERQLRAEGRPARRLGPFRGAARPRGPLTGLTLVLTRPAQDLRGEVEAYLALGAQPVAWPLTRPVIEPQPQRARALTEACDVLAFTSARAVTAWAASLIPGWDLRRLAGRRIGAVGEATALKLRQLGLVPDAVGRPATGEGLAQALAALGSGGRLLLVRAEEGLPRTPEALGEAGFAVTVWDAYRMEEEHRWDGPALEVVSARAAQALVAMSPGALRRAVERAGRDALAHLTVFAVGPTTAAEARALHLPRVRVAAQSSADGVRQSVVEWWHEVGTARRAAPKRE